ncbi:MAG: aminotransferase class I/II-fold pyridoxal phosphate-dependent enzyme [Pseudomonadales bacterium]|nr:aminotransferase class I/II-fold pyridoxal phosphate-dependent enzyme [Pseudomonadales bacterium]
MLSAKMANVSPFRVMTVMHRAAELEREGHKVVHMEVGEPDFSTALPIVNEAKKALDKGLTQYTSAPGIIELREAIAKHYKRKHRANISPDRILITPGASGGLSLLANMLVSPGDGVLLTDPAYPCVRNFIYMLSAEPQLIPVSLEQNFQPTLEQLEQFKTDKTVGLWLASPSNPTGTILEKDRLFAASDWAKSNGLHLLVDEIYHGLQYVEELPSVLEYDDSAFVVSSFSKYFGMTGWRLGWIVVPDDFVETANILAQNLFISAPSIAQYAALAAFTEEAEAIFEERRIAFGERKNYLAKELKSLGFKISDNIQGAFYIYANISKFSDNTEEFCRELLDSHHVAITPGTDFGEYKANEFVRIAFTTGMDDLKLGVERLKAALT